MFKYKTNFLQQRQELMKQNCQNVFELMNNDNSEGNLAPMYYGTFENYDRDCNEIVNTMDNLLKKGNISEYEITSQHVGTQCNIIIYPHDKKVEK